MFQNSSASEAIWTYLKCKTKYLIRSVMGCEMACQSLDIKQYVYNKIE
jgi:hypothetical protein